MARDPHRFRLTRAGVLNVWQYDEQVFDFADGRMLLRGTNGAGKSKTLEMLLPYVLDGDKARMVATGGRGSPLIWLMSDGATGVGTRTGYLWVELARTDPGGVRHVVTCGIGLRHSASARTVTSWQFTVPCEAPTLTEPDGTPLTAPALRELVAGLGGQSFDAPRAYKEHVGQLLFGLGPGAYDDLLRLLYWLRQPQVGEDLDPRRLVEMLDEALPALDEQAVRQVGEALDDLAAHGERVERLAATASAVQASAEVYGRYATTVLVGRAAAAREAERERASRARAVTSAGTELADVGARLAVAETGQRAAGESLGRARSRVQVLESGPLARNQQVLAEKQRRAEQLGRAGDRAAGESVRATERADSSQARAADGARELRAQGDRLASATAGLSTGLRTCGVDAPLPSSNGGDLGPEAVLEITTAREVGQAQGLLERVPTVRALVGAARAAVTVVREALTRLEKRTRDRAAAAERAAEAEAREEQAAGRLADAERALEGLDRDWQRDARVWLTVHVALLTGAALVDPASPLDPETLAQQVGDAVEPERTRLTEQQASAAADRVAADNRVQEAAERRAAVLDERDPSPPPPALPRPGRRDADGLAFWRLVDVREADPLDGGSVSVRGTELGPDREEPGQAGPGQAAPGQAALVEAALQASGLLDAQVLADGSLRVGDEADTVLGALPTLGGPSLADVLRPDVPPDSPVPTEVVARVLGAISLLDSCTAASTNGIFDGPPAVGRDGSWRLGPLLGRASKPAAQYVGSAARQAERARRLAEVDAAAAQARADRADAGTREQEARAELAELTRWLAAVPSARSLREAAVRRDERAEQRDRAQADSARRAGALETASRELQVTADALRRLGSEHGLPIEPAPLQVRYDALHSLDVGLETLRNDATTLLDAARRVEEDGETAERDVEQAEHAGTAARDARAEAEAAAQEAQALLDTLGADVQRMQAELDQARREARVAQTQRDQAEREARVLTGEQGQAVARLSAAQLRLAEALPALAAAVDAVTALRDVPGLWVAALGRDLDTAEHEALDALVDLGRTTNQNAGGHGETAPLRDGTGSSTESGTATGDLGRSVRLPRTASTTLHTWADLAVPRPADGNAVHADVRVLAAGPAADQEPRVVPVAGPRTPEPVLAVLARDAAGAEQPLAIAAVTLAAEVVREKELLTDRERTLFEEHLLGELGDALRSRRAEAGDLVRGMNELLSGVRTSQGIRVRLDWDLREDSGADVRDAVALLVRARGSLTPDESVRLRDALSALIETERAAEPEQGYTEHLSRALDYRRWSAFTVRLSRPAVQGWTTLTRRTPLSQGEQKVVCYLPLFAAAAAHFTSVAGAAPYAPRLILLDDAFPKIDVRTHPLLFGLLVDLDLDFVLTSERLWGDFATVPSLAVYEALRAPGERGIAQYRYTWDGTALVGQS